MFHIQNACLLEKKGYYINSVNNGIYANETGKETDQPRQLLIALTSDQSSRPGRCCSAD